MRVTCVHAVRMPKMLQVRNLPDSLHRKLKMLAAQKGMTLSSFVLGELLRVAEQPTIEEWIADVHKQPAVRLSRPVAEWVREERDSR